MVTRDPTTGKFVSDGKGGANADFCYDDLEIQNVTTSLGFNQDIAAGGSKHEQVNTVEPSDGLARNEVAELVAATISVESVINITDVTSPAWASAHVEVTADPAWDHGTEETVQDANGVTGFNVARGDHLDPDHLYHYMESFSSAIDDATNNTFDSGQGEGQVIQMPYRSWFGKGPVYDRHDHLHWHAWINNIGSATGDIEEETTLYWLVYEDPSRC